MHYAIVRHHQWWFTIAITLWMIDCQLIVVRLYGFRPLNLVWLNNCLIEIASFSENYTQTTRYLCMNVGESRRSCSPLASTFVFVFIFVFIFLFVFVFVFVFLFVFVFVFGWITRAEEVAPPWHPHLSKTRWVARYFPTLHGYNLLEIYLFIPLSIFNGILWKVRTHQQILLKPHLSWNAWHKQLHDLHVTPHLHSYTGPT